MATRGQGKPAAALASGRFQAGLMEQGVVPASQALPGRTPAGVGSPARWDAEEAALLGDRVRNGELPGQAVRAHSRVPQPDGKPAGEGGLHPGGVGPVSTRTPSPPPNPEPPGSREGQEQAQSAVGP